jgi:hypothetical protein
MGEREAKREKAKVRGRLLANVLLRTIFNHSIHCISDGAKIGLFLLSLCVLSNSKHQIF